MKKNALLVVLLASLAGCASFSTDGASFPCGRLGDYDQSCYPGEPCSKVRQICLVRAMRLFGVVTPDCRELAGYGLPCDTPEIPYILGCREDGTAFAQYKDACGRCREIRFKPVEVKP